MTSLARMSVEEGAVPTKKYTRAEPFVSLWLCYDLLAAACGQKTRHEVHSKRSSFKAITHASQTWLKPQGCEQAEVVLRQAWVVVAKVLAGCTKSADKAAAAAVGLRYAADVGTSSMRGEAHACGSACPQGLSGDLLARVCVLLQILGCDDIDAIARTCIARSGITRWCLYQQRRFCWSEFASCWKMQLRVWMRGS